mgnify:CR=1 FL=1
MLNFLVDMQPLVLWIVNVDIYNSGASLYRPNVVIRTSHWGGYPLGLAFEQAVGSRDQPSVVPSLGLDGALGVS